MQYLTAEEAAGLESWDKDEVVAIKTYVRTKSGRLEERLIYVSKDDYDAIKEGRADASEVTLQLVIAPLPHPFHRSGAVFNPESRILSLAEAVTRMIFVATNTCFWYLLCSRKANFYVIYRQ